MVLGRSDASIKLTEALAIVARSYDLAVGAETVTLAAGNLGILAQDIVASIAVPGADNSAVDGYAFAHSDLSQNGKTRLRLIGTSAAGHPYAGGIEPGGAVRIFTGAVIPAGLDTVVPQEDVTVDGMVAIIPSGPRLGGNRRLAGEDIAIGSRVLSAGARLGPASIGLLASLGIGAVSVRKRLKVAVFSTGDELCDASEQLAPGRIHDSNRPVLLAMLAKLGVAATDLGILPDNEDIIRAGLAEAAIDHHAVICSAGMSVGDEDHVKSAVRALGKLDFWSVAIKPGRPIAIGRIADAAFFGLPGNPVAMIVTFAMIVRPALLRLAGGHTDTPRRFPVEAAFGMVRKPGNREFLRCVLHEVDGRLTGRRFQRGGSGVLSSVAASDGLLEIAEDIAEITPGMTLPFIPFAELGCETCAVLLAGGSARRMGGGDKSLHTLAGRQILDHVMDHIRPQVSAIALNANDDPTRFALWGLPVIADLIAGKPGPLAGIQAGMAWARERYPGISHILSVPTDLPFLPADLVGRLQTALCDADADIAVASSAGRAHPVVALWPVDLADELRRAVADEGLRKVTAFAARYRVIHVDFPVTGPDPFFNINNPDDLQQAQSLT